MKKDDPKIPKINQRILDVIKYLDIKPVRFAEKIGASRGRISHISKGRNKPDSELLESILVNFKIINAHWLITGKGKMINPDEEKKSVVELPVSAIAQAGYVTEWTQENESVEESLVRIPGIKGAKVFQVHGESMYPLFFPGDYLVCKKIERWENVKNGSPYVIHTEEGLVVKYIDLTDEGKVFLQSENKDEFERYFVDLGELKGIWNIVKRFTGSLTHPRLSTDFLGDRGRIAKLEELVNKYLKK